MMCSKEECKIIELDDIVHVDFNSSQFTLCSRARVKYIPSATGDSWIFEDLDTPGVGEAGRIHYVSEGCTITLLQKGDAK